MANITAPVGLRHGTTPVTNNSTDMQTVINLLNKIPVTRGGTAERLVEWPADRQLRIPALAAAIKFFQFTNELPSQDCVVDPRGRTIDKLNELAKGGGGAPQPGGITVHEVPEKAGTWNDLEIVLVDPMSVPGNKQLEPFSAGVTFTRRLYRVEGSSIKWFGVVVPHTLKVNPTPHLYFTPTPWQGGCDDRAYDNLGKPWEDLWGTYCYWMGQQVAASWANQVLILPLYKNAQTNNLGTFYSNWKEVVTKLMTSAVSLYSSQTLGGLQLFRNECTFDYIHTSSFSAGWAPHKAFQTQADGAASMTRFLFDLDGQAAKPSSSSWRPRNGVIYSNEVPGKVNPTGTYYRLGGRWNKVSKFKGRYADFRQHWAVNQFMLYQGLWQHAT